MEHGFTAAELAEAKANMLNRYEQAVKQETTRKSEDIAEELGLPSDEVESLVLLGQPHVTALEELVSALPRVDDQAARAEATRALAAAIGRLPQRLQLILSLHYEEGLTYREIAKILDVSEPRICQLHGEAVGMLRKLLEG
jgi:RNA polymerase sigma factor for flagellar operon FliA